MSDIDISPLAKRLAEENNVDWRVLEGTGDAGKIVERDVLDYLARVMAGEADMDPTPEPLPAGMEAWSDVDPGFGGSDSSWSSGGTAGGGWDSGDEGLLEQDSPTEPGNDDWSSPPAEAAPAASDAPEPANDSDRARGFAAGGGSSPETEIDEDIFVFDDEPRSEPPADSPGGSASWADDAAGFDKRDTSESSNDFGGDDFFSLRDDEPVVPDTGSHGFSWDQPQDPGSEARGNESIPEFGFETPASGSAASDTTRIDEGGSSPWGEEETSRNQLNDAPTPWGDSETGGSLDSELSEPETPWEAAETFEQPLRDSWQDAGISGDQNLLEQQESDSWQDVPTTGSVREADAANSPWEAPSGTLPGSDDGFGGVDPTVAADPGSALPSERTANHVRQDSYRGEADEFHAEEARPVPSGMRRISGGGIALRRDVDLTALWHAQRAVTQELGLDEVIAPASFLLRAAARAGQPWPFTSPSDVPSRAVLSDAGVLAERLPDAGTMPFRDLVAVCRRSPRVSSDGDMTLAVADLSVLEIDEAVLDLGCPVLTLGRVLAQSQPDRFHGTLMLSGPVAPDAGSRFLGRVVELLSAPVRLVL